MRIDNLTIKSREMLADAETLARRLGHQEIAGIPVLHALYGQQDGTARPLLARVGVTNGLLDARIDESLKKRPQVRGGEVFPAAEFKELVDAAWKLADKMKDEFVNRVDGIFTFHRLTEEHLREIAGIQLNRVAKLLESKNLELAVSEEARSDLARRGYDPAYGARPLKRVIQTHVLEPLSEKIIEGEVKEGDRVSVDAHGDGLALRAA